MSISIDTFNSIKEKIETSRFAKRNYAAVDSTAQYFIYRLYRPFLKLKYYRFQKRNPNLPWLNPDIIRALEMLLNRDMILFEYGSGSSSIFFSKRVKHIHSLEHNPEWYHRVKEKIEKLDLSNISLSLVLPNDQLSMKKLNSIEQIGLSEEEYPLPDRIFKEYSDEITKMEDLSLDLVIVDGRARVTCSMNAIDKIKQGGILLLDNSERVRYSKIHEKLKDWPRLWTTSGLSDTTIWLKP